jgi:hypothetical protein
MFRNISSLTLAIEINRERTRLDKYQKASVRIARKIRIIELQILSLEQEAGRNNRSQVQWSRTDWCDFDSGANKSREQIDE